MNTATVASVLDSVSVDQVNGINRLNLYFPYEYTHLDWARNVLYVTTYELEKEDLHKGLPNSKGVYFFSIWYNFENGENRFEKRPTITHRLFFEKALFYDYSKYIISNMTPSDFQAYDKALSDFYQKSQDEIFNVSFYEFILRLSTDQYLEPQEKKVLRRLITWTINRPKAETPDHFYYFKSKLQDTKGELIIED